MPLLLPPRPPLVTATAITAIATIPNAITETSMSGVTVHGETAVATAAGATIGSGVED
ncbi:MAG: hypothetical protein JO204_04860, partial [Alphaproteobacteria bacterium]|nr:hypothetical protein [Alphaproteobacteria bacterium]